MYYQVSRKKPRIDKSLRMSLHVRAGVRRRVDPSPEKHTSSHTNRYTSAIYGPAPPKHKQIWNVIFRGGGHFDLILIIHIHFTQVCTAVVYGGRGPI